ncbi:DEAD/DEAH box helicase [Clostridium sporogenes]|uniref:DEAD/DEAH box helicase n=1 Tax=Clostridium sporogenes TaxID=1509 RepID=UPI0013D162D3|nr:DEAD/DEAH box helicase [Clostridium sporogenes]MCW6090445.1 DEAD/DEAH box helicase [Clostridium sporogenes]NFH46000.1 DEAD/DEAH box helicase [Clostridium sporogenes]
MNLRELVEIVLIKCSKLVRIEGKKIYKSELVYDVKSKKINNIYNIYGKVKNENKINDYYTHVKINISKGILEKTKCSCDDFIENSAYDKEFLCPHIIATTYKFYDLAIKRLKDKSNKKEDKSKTMVGNTILNEITKYENLKEKLNISVKLNHINNDLLDYYEAQFKIGKKNMYSINSLEDFIQGRIQGNKVFINNELIYNPRIHYFSIEDEKVINFIEEYVLLNKELFKSDINVPFQIVNGRNLRILPSTLARFLQSIQHKTIKFKYEYIDYNIKIINKDLPVSFTLKDNKENFILTTKKQLPIPLTSKDEVYFYDKNLYIPSNTQRNLYKLFYKNFKKQGNILFSKDAKTFKKLIVTLNKISQVITFDEGVKNFVSTLIVPKFYFYKESEQVCCQTKLYYGEEYFELIKDSKKKNLSNFIKINLPPSIGERLYVNNVKYEDYAEEDIMDKFIIRDLEKEEKIVMELEKFRFIKGENRFLFIGEENDLYNLLTKGLKSFRNIGEVTLSDSFKTFDLYDLNSIESHLTETSEEWLNLSYSIGDVSKKEFKNIFRAFKHNKSFYKTKDNSFIDLKDDGVRNFLGLLEDLSFNMDISGEPLKIHKNRAYYIENRGASFIKEKDLLKNISNKILGMNNEYYEVPKNLNATLREYQIAGYKWMKTLSNLRFGGVLADEMGLGKTIQTISFLLSEKGCKSLIVTPTSLIYNWQDEFQRFANDLRIGVVHGSLDQRMKVLDNIEEYDVLLTTYGTLRNDVKLYKEIIFDYCIIDEGQNIKNPLAQSTDSVKKINSKVRFALTGTPIENNLMELWSIFDFIMPGYLYNEERFQEKFINAGEENIDKLKTFIRPFILRREKKDVLKDLPDKIEKKFLVEMTSNQGRIYKAYMKNIKEKLKNNKEDRITIFSYLTKLRQLCLDPSLIIDEYKGGSGKLKIAMELLQEGVDEGKKILLFSQFTSVLKNISKLLDKEGIEYLYLDGSTNASDRIKLVNKFNDSSHIKVFLISLKAGGTGLNLTSGNLVIHFDPWWNPAIEDQATDRAHRIGQKNLVDVIKLVCKETIEEKIITLQEDKKELINNVMNSDLKNGHLINTLSKEEILDLFNN